jgi:hypothetical protein
MANLPSARKRLTDLVKGLRKMIYFYGEDGKKDVLSENQLLIQRAYARQIERIVEDDLQD